MNLNSRMDIAVMKPEKASKKITVPLSGRASFSAPAVEEMEIHNTGRRMGNEMIVYSDPFPPAFAAMAASGVVDAAIENQPAITDIMKWST